MSAPDSAIDRLLNAAEQIRALAAARGPTGMSHADADDDAGTLATDGARDFDPMPLLRALSAQGAPAVVIGQVAAILHGDTELTGDLDLLWSGRSEDAGGVLAALRSVGARVFDGAAASLPLDAHALTLPKVQFEAAGVQGDCCTPKLTWGGIDVEPFLQRAEVAVAAGGLRVRYLAASDLIAMREALGRPKDLRRVERLRALL